MNYCRTLTEYSEQKTKKKKKKILKVNLINYMFFYKNSQITITYYS